MKFYRYKLILKFSVNTNVYAKNNHYEWLDLWYNEINVEIRMKMGERKKNTTRCVIFSLEITHIWLACMEYVKREWREWVSALYRSDINCKLFRHLHMLLTHSHRHNIIIFIIPQKSFWKPSKTSRLLDERILNWISAAIIG